MLQREAFLQACEVEALDMEIERVGTSLRQRGDPLALASEPVRPTSTDEALEASLEMATKVPKIAEEDDVDVPDVEGLQVESPAAAQLWQRLQSRLVARNRPGPGRPVIVLAGPKPLPDEVTFWPAPLQPVLSSSSLANRGTSREVTSRLVVEAVASAEECSAVRGAATVAMRGLFHRGGQTTLALTEDLLRRAPGLHSAMTELVERSRLKLQQHSCSGPNVPLELSGAMITRLRCDDVSSGAPNGAVALDGWEVDPRQIYWRSHMTERMLPRTMCQRCCISRLRSLIEAWS